MEKCEDAENDSNPKKRYLKLNKFYNEFESGLYLLGTILVQDRNINFKLKKE